jgi:hypothetical protein
MMPPEQEASAALAINNARRRAMGEQSPWMGFGLFISSVPRPDEARVFTAGRLEQDHGSQAIHCTPGTG